MVTVMGHTWHHLEQSSRQKKKQNKTNDHLVLPFSVQVYWEEAWCMRWNECCGCVVAFLQHVSDMWWWSTAVAVVAQTSYFVSASYLNRKPMKWFQMCGQVRWHWKAQDYSSCIVQYPLKVGCHIMSRTKQQWVTVVNSRQSKSRYKCGSCSTCRESTHWCQTTQFMLACPSNLGDTFIHCKMTVKCKTQILHSVWRKCEHCR